MKLLLSPCPCLRLSLLLELLLVASLGPAAAANSPAAIPSVPESAVATGAAASAAASSLPLPPYATSEETDRDTVQQPGQAGAQLHQQQQQQGDFSLPWLTDIHLDYLYDPVAPVSKFCHTPDPQETSHEAPIVVQTRRLAVLSGLQRHKQQQQQHAEEAGGSAAEGTPAAAPTAAPAAAESLGDELTKGQAGETEPRLGRAGCDSPPALVLKALKFAASLASKKGPAADALHAPAAALLLTGDYAAHYDDNQIEIRREAIRLWTEALFKHFPQDCGGHEQRQDCMQLLLVAGNNDMPADYLVPSARPDWTAFLFDLWAPALPRDAAVQETFKRGLYYKTQLRKAPGVVVLCLNTVLYSRDARNKLRAAGVSISQLDDAENSDPAGQLAWMRQQLQEARDRNQQVLIAGHIPPGFSSHLNLGYSEEGLWTSRFTKQYRSIVNKYSDVVLAQAFGHIHFGRIRALIPQAESSRQAKPSALLVAPAVSPIHGNNPAVAALIFKQRAAFEKAGNVAKSAGPVVLSDYVQYSLPLYGFVGPGGRGGIEPDFSFEFGVHETFAPFVTRGSAHQQHEKQEKHQHQIDGEFAVQLGKALRLSPMLFALYEWHAVAGGQRIPSRVRSCEVLALTEDERYDCLADNE